MNCKCVGSLHDGKILVRQATKDEYAECIAGGVADLGFPNSETRRGRVQNGGACPRQ